jgi:hypothetical protein
MATRVISAIEFIQELNNLETGGEAIISDFEVHGIVTINPENFKGRQINIFSCKFIDRLGFIHVDNLGISIEGCEIGALSFIHDTIREGENELLGEGFIVLYNTKINGRLIFNECNVVNGIRIYGKSEIESLEIFKTSLKNFNIGGSEINSNLIITESEFTSEFTLAEVTIGHRAIITRTRFGRMAFNKSTIASLEMGGCTTKSEFVFLRTTVIGDVTIFGIRNFSDSISPSFTIIDSLFKKNIEITCIENTPPNGFQNIHIRASQFENGLTIKGWKNLSTIANVNINCSRQLTGEISLQNFIITDTQIKGINSDASIIFDNVQFVKLSLSNFTNNGNLQFINISPIDSPDTKLLIENSHLGKTQFASTNLANFSSILIENSNLTDISASTTKWFSLTQLRANWPKKKWFKTFRMAVPVSMRALYLHHCRQQRELFRQLKFAMEKQGDRIQSLEFKQYEMIAYRNALNLSKGKIGERLIMWVNRSNSYGQNWWKPVLWAIGITALFYFLITTAQSPDINGVEFSRNGANRLWSTLWKNLGVFFQMLNPVHLIDKMSEGAQEINKMTYFLDYLYRIIISYLIFQTISAFRKYVK